MNNILESYKKAYRIVTKREERKIFRRHLIAYLIANSLFIIANLVFTPEYYWFVYPLFGWGSGVFLHYLSSIKFIDKKLEKLEKLAISEMEVEK